MKRSIRTFAILILMVSMHVSGQDFQGTAVYESKKNLQGLKIDGKGIEDADEVTKLMMERLKKRYEKTFILNFNKYESVYYELQKLQIPSPGFSGDIASSGSEQKTYKNVKTRLTLIEEEFLGKEFLIIDSLEVFNWQLQEESKKIGDYICYKAVIVKEVSKQDLEMYQKEKEKQDLSKTAFFNLEEPKEKIITVWYTPEIPINQGPDEFWGLPGLIMEANFGETLILCSKTVLNPKEKFEIKKPKNGKKVTKKEYANLVEKQMNSMKDENGVIHFQSKK